MIAYINNKIWERMKKYKINTKLILINTKSKLHSWTERDFQNFTEHCRIRFIIKNNFTIK